ATPTTPAGSGSGRLPTRGSSQRRSGLCRTQSSRRSGRPPASAARADARSRRWRATPCCARLPSPASPPSRFVCCRTRSASPIGPCGGLQRRGKRLPTGRRASSWSSSVPDLPPPLPPERRTVGQLVAETIRAYGKDFWRALPLGVPLAVADQLSVRQTALVQMLVYWALLPLFVAGYVWACRLVLGVAPTATAAA